MREKPKTVCVVIKTSETPEERHDTMVAFTTRSEAERYIKEQFNEFQREHYEEFVNGDLETQDLFPGFVEVMDGWGEYIFTWLLHEATLNECATGAVERTMC